MLLVNIHGRLLLANITAILIISKGDSNQPENLEVNRRNTIFDYFYHSAPGGFG
jgi:hypothetical protein